MQTLCLVPCVITWSPEAWPQNSFLTNILSWFWSSLTMLLTLGHVDSYDLHSYFLGGTTASAWGIECSEFSAPQWIPNPCLVQEASPQVLPQHEAAHHLHAGCHPYLLLCRWVLWRVGYFWTTHWCWVPQEDLFIPEPFYMSKLAQGVCYTVHKNQYTV